MLLASGLFALAACSGGGGSSGGGSGGGLSFGTGPRTSYPADAFYVTEYSPQAVRAIRESVRFSAHDLRVDYGYSLNPALSGTVIPQNALAAANVHYAHSVGLTGRGQTIALNDTSIRASHAEFSGKRLSTSGVASSARFHGTAVASVAAGSARSGTMVGVAPGADLHVGQMEFGVTTSFGTLTENMEAATRRRAIVSSNSWNFAGATLANTDIGTAFGRPDGRAYVESLQRFAERGVIVVGVQNDFFARSINVLNALPRAYPGLERSWIAVISAVPRIRDGRIGGAARLSAACNEAARYCLAANGTVRVADVTGDLDYASGGGTSFAAPQVAGAVALLAEAFPDLTPSQLRDRLLITANNAWFNPDGTVEFAPGLSHGYSNVYGHGFLDLRAALLPIGPLATPLPAGGSVPYGAAHVISGGASGDALSRALATQSLMVRDRLHGSFLAPAGGILARRATAPAHQDLSAAMARDQWAAFQGRLAAFIPAERSDLAPSPVREGAFLLDGEGIAAFSDLEAIALPTVSGGLSITGYLPQQGSDLQGAGIGVARLLRRGSVDMTFGLTMTSDPGDMLGVEVAGAGSGMRTDALAASAALGMPLASGWRISARAETGVADGPGAGVVTGFSDVRFSSYGAGITRRGVLGRNDLLGLRVRRPLAITGGAARFQLATGMDGRGAARFEDVGVPLAPDRRQTDLALEYLATLAPRTTLALSTVRSWNAGHISGERDLAGMVVLERRF